MSLSWKGRAVRRTLLALCGLLLAGVMLGGYFTQFDTPGLQFAAFAQLLPAGIGCQTQRSGADRGRRRFAT